MLIAARLIALVLVLAASAGVAAADATLTRFTPQGAAKQVRQAVAQFSEPIVALGDPSGGPVPFDVSCPEAGTGRWVDALWLLAVATAIMVPLVWFAQRPTARGAPAGH